MNKMKSLVIAASCMMVMNAGAAFAYDAPAAEAAQPVKIAESVEKSGDVVIPQRLNKVFITYGEIIEVNGNKITVKGEGDQEIIAAVAGADTYIVDGKKGKAKKVKDLKAGKKVTVYYSGMMTRSLPPQARAFAFVLGDREDVKQGIYTFFPVAKVMPGKDGKSVKVLNVNEDVIATVTAKACKNFDQIKAGDNLLLRYNIITMSLPGQTNAEKAIILPPMK